MKEHDISKDGWAVARATLNLDTCFFGLTLSGDAELRTDCKKMQFWPLSHRALSARGRRRSGLKPARSHREQKGRDAAGDGVRIKESDGPLQQNADPQHETKTPPEIQSIHLRPHNGHQFRHFLIELVRQEVDYILACLVASSSSLRQHLVRGKTLHLEGQMARGGIKIRQSA